MTTFTITMSLHELTQVWRGMLESENRLKQIAKETDMLDFRKVCEVAADARRATIKGIVQQAISQGLDVEQHARDELGL